jgi:hypothetical protein
MDSNAELLKHNYPCRSPPSALQFEALYKWSVLSLIAVSMSGIWAFSCWHGSRGFLILVASRSHPDTPHSIGLLWTSVRPVAETWTWQHTTLTTDTHAPAGFEPAISASERLQTHALDRAATGIGCYMRVRNGKCAKFKFSVFYFKGFLFWFVEKDVSAMLQCGTARTVLGHRGQGFKWCWGHGPVRVLVFVVSVETKTEKGRRKLEQGMPDTYRCKLTHRQAFTNELPACRNILTHRIGRLFNWQRFRGLR